MMWAEIGRGVAQVIGFIAALGLFLLLPVVILGMAPGRFRKNVAEKPRFALVFLFLLWIMTEFHMFALMTGVSILFVLVGLIEQFYLLGWLFWERKSGISFRRRNLFMGVIYVMLAANISTGYFAWRDFSGEPRRARAARAKAEIRNLAVTLETYFIDHNIYPPAVDANGKVVTFKPDGATVSSGYVPWILTTPIAYTSTIPFDPFPDKKTRKQVLYRYATNGTACWIMTSNGPDGDPDIKIGEYPVPSKGNCSWRTFMSQFGVGDAIEYDATNGTTSSGDVLRVGP